MNTTLVKVKQLQAIDIYKDNAMDDILQTICNEMTKEVPNVETATGRKRIISLAATVAKVKKHIDEVGKTLVSDWKNQSKIVDNERKKARDILDALRDEIRAPVTEWENKEKDRIEQIHARIDHFAYMARATNEETGLSYYAIKLYTNLDLLKDCTIEGKFGEFEKEAHSAKQAAIQLLEENIGKRKRTEEETARIEKMRTDRIDEERKAAEIRADYMAREDERRKIADERADEEVKQHNALQEAARQKAHAEQEAAHAEFKLARQEEATRIEKEALAEKAADELKRVEQSHKDAIEQARIDAIEFEKQEREDAAQKRAANLENRRKCNTEALDAFINGGLEPEHAKIAVMLIAKKSIPHISINY